jgi:hypothetical protein
MPESDFDLQDRNIYSAENYLIIINECVNKKIILNIKMLSCNCNNLTTISPQYISLSWILIDINAFDELIYNFLYW